MRLHWHTTAKGTLYALPSRNQPGQSSCFLLIDQSGSMEDPFAGSDSKRRKADLLADAINRLLQNLVIKCAKEEGIRLLLGRRHRLRRQGRAGAGRSDSPGA